MSSSSAMSCQQLDSLDSFLSSYLCRYKSASTGSTGSSDSGDNNSGNDEEDEQQSTVLSLLAAVGLKYICSAAADNGADNGPDSGSASPSLSPSPAEVPFLSVPDLLMVANDLAYLPKALEKQASRLDEQARLSVQKIKQKQVNIYPDWWWQEKQTPVVHSGKRRTPPKLAYSKPAQPKQINTTKGRKQQPTTTKGKSVLQRREEAKQYHAETKSLLMHIPTQEWTALVKSNESSKTRDATPLEVATSLLKSGLVDDYGGLPHDDGDTGGENSAPPSALKGGGLEGGGKAAWVKSRGGWAADFSTAKDVHPKSGDPDYARWRGAPRATPSAELWAELPRGGDDVAFTAEEQLIFAKEPPELDFDAILAAG